MSIEIRQQFPSIPRLLREMIEKGRPEYEELIRRTRWGEVPIRMVGSGASYAVGLAGAYAFENLLGWPVVVRTPEEFQAYSQSSLRPRSILFVLSWEGSAGLVELLRSAKGRGATVLALTGDRQSPLAQAADGVFLARGREESRQDSTAGVMQLAAMHSLAVVAARVLKRPSPQTLLLEGELLALPDHVEWALTQLPEAVRSCVGQLFPACAISLVAGGLYYPAALLGASVLRSLGGRRVQVLAPDELAGGAAAPFESRETVVVLSGSRSPLRKQVHAVVEKLQRAGVEILAISDHNEAEVTRRAKLAVLLPNLSEQVGSIVALVFLAWVAGHLAAHAERQEPPPSGA